MSKFTIVVALGFAAVFVGGILLIAVPGALRDKQRSEALEVSGVLASLRGPCVPICDDDDDDFIYDPYPYYVYGTNQDGLDNCGSTFNATVQYSVDNETYTGDAQGMWLSNPCFTVTPGRAVSLMIDKIDRAKILSLEQNAGDWPPRADGAFVAGLVIVVMLSLAALVMLGVVIHAKCC